MKPFYTILLLAGIVMAATAALAGDAPDTAWKKSVDFNLAVTQNAYSDSWAGGEAGSASWAANLNSLFEGPLSGRWGSKSTIKFAFGQTHSQDEQTKDWRMPVKSTDLIDLESVLKYTTGWFVDPFFAARFESQFLDASVPSVKRYVNPIKLTESFGFTKRLFVRDKEFIDSRIGFALKELIDRRIADTAKETFSTVTTTDGGLESVTDLSLKLNQNILWTAKLTIFKALSVSNKDALYWPNPDINWENIFSATVTKYIIVNLYTQWLYDKQIDKRGRFKETLALGLTYKLL